jgi:hypothetical protein
MGQCVWCGNSGFFLSIDKDRLCNTCAFVLKSEAESRLRAMKNCERMIERTKNIEIAINNYFVIIDYLKYFLPHEAKGLKVYNEKTSVIISGIFNDKNEKMMDLLLMDKEKTLEKLNKSKTYSAKVNLIEKFIYRVNKYKPSFEQDAENYPKIKESLRKLILFEIT